MHSQQGVAKTSTGIFGRIRRLSSNGTSNGTELTRGAEGTGQRPHVRALGGVGARTQVGVRRGYRGLATACSAAVAQANLGLRLIILPPP